MIERYLQSIDQFILASYLRMFNDSKGTLGLLFHAVFWDQGEIESQEILPQQQLTFPDYRKIFERLLEQRYVFLSYDDLRNELDPAQKYAYVTFDDGYFNNTRLLPLIEELGIPIHIFVCTRNILEGRKFWWDVVYSYRKQDGISDASISQELECLKRYKSAEIVLLLEQEFGPSAFHPRSDLDRPLSIPELSDLAAHELVTIGNHTHGHEIVTNLSISEFQKDVVLCSKIISEKTNTDSSSFAFPNGNYSDSYLRALEELGFDAIFSCEARRTVLPQDGSQPRRLLMARHTISARTDLDWQIQMVRAGASPYFWGRKLYGQLAQGIFRRRI